MVTLHGTSQPPQLVVVLSGSQPLAALPSQFWWLALQLAIRQLPLLQVAVALAREHVMPQSVQSVSVRMLVSQPGIELQLLKPVLHV